MANKFNFDRVLRNFKGVDLSLDIANVAKNDFLGNFRAQGFGGNPWQDVKRRTDPTKKQISDGSSTRAILQGKRSGKLRKDVANSVMTGRKNSKLSYTLVVENPYAGYLNEGTPNMVKRQFVGTTIALNNKILKKIDQKLKNIWAT
ncbi:MAG: hypothetical protein H7296_08515 [Bacteroidia bacterium]|nr:hypothetical protein [Bacteroidia bacterium]